VSLQKTKSNTLKSIAAERHHNSIGNRLGTIAHASHILGEGRRAHAMHISYLRKRETCPSNACFISKERGSPFLCIKMYINRCSMCQHVACPLAHICACMLPIGTGWPNARCTAWSTRCLTSSKPLHRRGFKSWRA
jgi:hypothetical protein